MDINLEIEKLLQANESHQKAIDQLKCLVKENNRKIGKLKTIRTHAESVFLIEQTVVDPDTNQEAIILVKPEQA